MNLHRDEKGDDARQCLTAVDLVDITRPEAVIIEAPAALFVADNAKLFQQFTSKVDAINYVMHIITMEASYGSLQARPRLYPVLIRHDIHESRRPFCGPSPSMLSQRTLRDVVLHADHPDLPALRSTQHWKRIRDGTRHLASYKGPRCEWSTEGEGTACKGYSLDGSAPTQTGSDTHIFDDHLGYVRKLHEQERLNIIGQPGLQFPSHITDDKRRHLIGQTMGAKCVEAIGNATIAYLDSDCIPAAMRTITLDIHCDANHPGKDVSRKMGIAFPKDCCICPLGKSKRSPQGKLPVPKSTVPAGRIACDVKEVHETSHDGNTCCFGFIDSCANRSWLKPMAGRTAADLIMCCDELVSQDLHGCDVIGMEFVTDNGSAMASEEFKAYCRRPDRRWKLRYSSAYHQHQNPCECLWGRLSGLTTINLSQSPWLGYEYWDRAMCHANYAIQSWPSTGNEGGRSPNETWDTHMSGKEGPHRLPKHLVRWGKAGYVYDDSGGFRPTGIKGYCIGYSHMHARGCYDMLMPSKRILRKQLRFPEIAVTHPPDTFCAVYGRAQCITTTRC
jgi:hypothetical protein